MSDAGAGRLREVVVVDPDPSWPSRFAAARSEIAGALGAEVVVAVHHVGSTSVPGLAAKPILDLLLEARSLASLDAAAGRLAALGYIARGEYGIRGRRYFHRGARRRTHHLHAFAAGDAHVVRHLAFRDYLRAHPAVAAQYGALKRAVAAACDHDIERYMDGKHDFVQRVEALALRRDR